MLKCGTLMMFDAFVGAVLTFASTMPSAPNGTPVDPVAHGLAEYKALRYESAIRSLKLALESAQLTQAQRVLALAYMARNQAVLGRYERAIQSFIKVLKLDPKYKVPWGESPRIKRAFAGAQARIAKRKKKKRTNASARNTAVLHPPLAELPPKPAAEEGKIWYEMPEFWVVVGILVAIAGISGGAAGLVNAKETPPVATDFQWNLP